ncbi:MAG TPA: hypothetical protein PLY23_01145 [Alphaproteobacteria bacterium]|nr:hypothetical protein [Alphaproteobacteria bacterium]HQS93273.1 hypothetical protein [Alphaproteobacteria bacterium]
MKTKLLLACLAVASLSGCTKPGQNQYSHKDVGQSTLVEFGTVLAVRNVDIIGENTGVGALIGAGTGAGAGSYLGGGTGNVWAIAGGALIGAAAGAFAEQGISDGPGIEYAIIKENGQTVTIVQNKKEGDIMFPVGSRVLVQISGSYQRVLPADNLPEQIKRPKGIKIID